MADFTIKRSLTWIQSHFLASGYFRGVVIGHPWTPPTEKITVAIFMESQSILNLTVGGATQELHVVTARIFRPALSEPIADVESDIAEAVSLVQADLLADTTLGSTVMTIDPAGMSGTGMSTAFGHVEIGGTNFRIADITIPLLVNDSATMAV